jgi:phosphopentomutase
MNQSEPRRVFVLLLDSLGIGAAVDAGEDAGSDTLGHIAQWCAQGRADQSALRAGPLHVPHLMRLGLGAAYHASTGQPLAGVPDPSEIISAYGYAIEKSVGKDTPSGHWEMMGVPVMSAWTTFPHETPCFPKALIDALVEQAQLPGVLGQCHASGTDIIRDLGQEHIETGKPIVYTSADSVFQIAAHEDYFPLEQLYALCEQVRKLIDPYNVGRVIARPFVGDADQGFTRTGNRRDWATPPPKPTLFDVLSESGREVIAIGKTADIFAHRGVAKVVKANGIEALFDVTLTEVDQAPPGSLTFTNFVDFDSHFGHRRDVAGYADALERFDVLLPELERRLQPGDMVVISADHGCDPTWPGSNHTREHIPAIFYGPNIKAGLIGARQTFADIGQTLAAYLGAAALGAGESVEEIY